jgi:hypothetical protein
MTSKRQRAGDEKQLYPARPLIGERLYGFRQIAEILQRVNRDDHENCIAAQCIDECVATPAAVVRMIALSADAGSIETI